MGEVRAKVRFVNAFDLHAKAEPVRQVELDCLVDSGAVLPYLPQEVVERLGVPDAGRIIVRYADERKEELQKAGPVRIEIGDRHGHFDCVVGPPNCEALIGQIVLEELDLIVDPAEQRLSVRPESPFLPLLKVK